MERTLRLISCAALLGASTCAALAQDQPVQPPPGEFGALGQPGQGQPVAPRGFGRGGPGQLAPFGQGPAGPPIGMFNPMPAMPEMAKKMVAIMALRQMYAVGLTSRDISAALPALKNMREVEKTLESRSNQILDEEKRALLAAAPNTPLPQDSGQRLMEASASYRQQMDRGWEAITNGIGPDKAGLLRGLVEGGVGMGQGGPRPPGAGGGFGGFGQGFERIPATPAAPNGQPGPFPNAPAGAPAANDPALAPAGVPAPQGDGELAPEPGAALPAQQPGFRGQGRGQNGFPPRQVQPQPGQSPGFFGNSAPFPGQNPGNFAPGMPGMPGVPGMGGPRMSLADLIDLLEQKQAAMRR